MWGFRLISAPHPLPPGAGQRAAPALVLSLTPVLNTLHDLSCIIQPGHSHFIPIFSWWTKLRASAWVNHRHAVEFTALLSSRENQQGEQHWFMLVVNIVPYLFHTAIQRRCILKISLAVVQISSNIAAKCNSNHVPLNCWKHQMFVKASKETWMWFDWQPTAAIFTFCWQNDPRKYLCWRTCWCKMGK